MEKDEEELYKEEPSSPDVDTPLARKNFTWLEKLLYLKPFLFLILVCFPHLVTILYSGHCIVRRRRFAIPSVANSS